MPELNLELGASVRTPESLPVSYGEIVQVYQNGRFFEVRKQYGRKVWRRKYMREELEAAAALEQRLIAASRRRAAANRKLKRKKGRS